MPPGPTARRTPGFRSEDSAPPGLYSGHPHEVQEKKQSLLCLEPLVGDPNKAPGGVFGTRGGEPVWRGGSLFSLYRIARRGARGDNACCHNSALAHPANQYRSGPAVEREGECRGQLGEKTIAAPARAQKDECLWLLTQTIEKRAALIGRENANIAALKVKTDRSPSYADSRRWECPRPHILRQPNAARSARCSPAEAREWRRTGPQRTLPAHRAITLTPQGRMASRWQPSAECQRWQDRQDVYRPFAAG